MPEPQVRPLTMNRLFLTSMSLGLHEELQKIAWLGTRKGRRIFPKTVSEETVSYALNLLSLHCAFYNWM